MTDPSHKHPADALALALERSSGLLNSVTDLYDSDREQFAGSEAFVAHAVSTVALLLADAKNALADLHFCCDLTLLDHVGDDGLVVNLEKARDEVVPEPAAEPVVNLQPQSQHVEPDSFATSYLELLNKLTAAEVCAAEQQALSAPGASPDLLPILKSLREDLQKIHNAA